VINNIGYQLKEVGDFRAVEPLIDALKDPTSVVRSHSVTALGKIGGPQACPAVISALKAEAVRNALDIGVCYRAIEALHRLGEAAAEFLISALKHPDTAIRRKAATLLGKTGEVGAVDLLIGALKDEHPRVRSRAAHALGRIGSPSAVKPLTVALKDPAPNVRINALHVLEKFGESTAALTSALADPTTSVRRHAITVLEKNRQ
jgi:HEAT repeat protein